MYIPLLYLNVYRDVDQYWYLLMCIPRHMLYVYPHVYPDVDQCWSLLFLLVASYVHTLMYTNCISRYIPSVYRDVYQYWYLLMCTYTAICYPLNVHSTYAYSQQSSPPSIVCSFFSRKPSDGLLLVVTFCRLKVTEEWEEIFEAKTLK